MCWLREITQQRRMWELYRMQWNGISPNVGLFVQRICKGVKKMKIVKVIIEFMYRLLINPHHEDTRQEHKFCGDCGMNYYEAKVEDKL